MGRELEWKYRAQEQILSAIEAKYGPFSPIAMETTYYDTPDLKLAFHQWTLRRRMENGVSVCTFKRPLADGSRGEWEAECGNIMEGVLQLCRKGADWELMRSTAGGVIELCGARVTRLAATLSLSDAVVEIALDRGILTGRNKSLPFAEVEVEYKEGSEETAKAFAQSLAAEFSLTEEPKSKFVRAMALAF